MKKSMNRYTKTEWRNGQAPALNAENLNKIENGIEAITNEVIRSVQNVQLSGSASYPNVDSAIENDIVYRVFAQGNGSPCGWLRFCGSKNYVGGVGVAQIRMDMSGKIYIRKGAANGGTVTWPQTWDAFEPGGGASNAVLEITEETVPESVNWDDRIPVTFSGNGYKLAFYCGELWALYSANEDPQTGDINYEWLKLVSEIEYDDIKSRISGKMSFTPLNPTAEQIAALPAGQLYDDSVNHKAAIKGGQSFYSTEYINGNYRKTIISTNRPPIGAPAGTDENIIRTGDIWLESSNGGYGKMYQCFYALYNFSPVPASIPPQHYYYWKPLNNVVSNSHIEPPDSAVHERITYTINGVTFSWFPFSEYYLNDVYYYADKKFMLAHEPNGSNDGEHQTYYYTWKEVDYYTKTEINTMIGDIGSAIDTLNGNIDTLNTNLSEV